MWIFATRNRVENCKRFINLWIKTKANSPVYLRLDECDPTLEEMKSLPWPKEFLMNIGPRVRLAGSMNEMFVKFPNESFYGLLADDLIPETDFWDKRLIDAAGSSNISCANEVYEKRKRICHPCIGGELVRHIGFFAIPGLLHFYTDTLWEDLHWEFDKYNRQDNVILAHAHFRFEQAKQDQTYIESQSIIDLDRAVYTEWKEKNWSTITSSIKEKFGW